MSRTTQTMNCQLNCLPLVAAPISKLGKIVQLRNRIRRIVKRRVNYLMNVIIHCFTVHSKLQNQEKAETIGSVTNLTSGDLVQVKSRQEIKGMLDPWNRLKGCVFMEEMWGYCGTKQQVLKRVETFLDERDYLMKKTKGIVILKDVICQGTKDFGPCDRSCFFFWREEWLVKVN